MYSDSTDEIKVGWDENGLHLIIKGDAMDCDFRVSDPEQLYDRVKAAIGPWLRERDEAFAEFRQAAQTGTGPAAAYFACKDIDESGGVAERVVAIHEDGSLRMEPDEEPDDWRERLAGNADWSRKAERENR